MKLFSSSKHRSLIERTLHVFPHFPNRHKLINHGQVLIKNLLHALQRCLGFRHPANACRNQRVIQKTEHIMCGIKRWSAGSSVLQHQTESSIVGTYLSLCQSGPAYHQQINQFIGELLSAILAVFCLLHFLEMPFVSSTRLASIRKK